MVVTRAYKTMEQNNLDQFTLKQFRSEATRYALATTTGYRNDLIDVIMTHGAQWNGRGFVRASLANAHITDIGKYHC
ncbi:hypothetical protein X777_09766 [Ooceraea biroi]|uniref:Uncharacterized protein n=1 Tax=Ooceraea biroi TaxID=2015173 RepID=A0A026W7G5_OOCBI|nr:hypothetical protein X777_09766 [Ooceraea biroi]